MKYIAFATAFVLVIIDRITKYFAFEHLFEKQVPVIDNVLYLVYTTNDGAAFSSFRGQREFLILITSILLIGIVIAILANVIKSRFLVWSLLLIAAGGAGNLIDRIRTGEVPDFIYFKLINFPIFNFADICAVCGALMLVLYVIFGEGKAKKERAALSAEYIGSLGADMPADTEAATLDDGTEVILDVADIPADTEVAEATEATDNDATAELHAIHRADMVNDEL